MTKAETMQISDFLSQATEGEPVATPWGSLNWRITGEAMAGSEMTFGVVTIMPGERNPLHSHPNCEEILYVLSGSCEHRLGDATFPMHPGDAIRIPSGIPHWARCLGPEPLVAVIAFSSGDRRTDSHEDEAGAA
jgi:quercetin dioxygenase-like cupin family protein